MRWLLVSCPKTEGIKYAGSKLKLLPYILQLARKVKPRTILDGFAGTTRVSQAFAQLGYKIVSNDLAVWSKVFDLCYLKNKKSRKYYFRFTIRENSTRFVKKLIV